MTDNLPAPGGVMYVDAVTDYGPAMDQSNLEPDFEVGQNLGVYVIPEEVAEDVERIQEELQTFDYTDEERREKRREMSEMVTDAVASHGIGMGYHISIPEGEDDFEPRDILTLDQIGEHEYVGVFGLTDLNYKSNQPSVEEGRPVDIDDMLEGEVGETDVEFDEYGQIKDPEE